MKHLTTLLAVILLITTGCHKNKYYVCYCNYTNGALDTFGTYNLGRMDKDAAYAECSNHVDSITMCNMAVMK